MPTAYSTSQSPREQPTPDDKQTYYEILQIPSTANADEIKAAFRSLVVHCHPDKAPSVVSKDAMQSVAGSKNVHLISGRLSSIDFDDEDKQDETSNYATEVDGNDDNELEIDNSAFRNRIGLEPSQGNGQEGEEDITNNQHLAKFHQVQAAYDCLRDPRKRREYDESIRRKKEKEEWKWRGAVQVNLSEMESDMCCIIDSDTSNDDCDSSADLSRPLRKVFFHPCRCGDTFQIVAEELRKSIQYANGSDDEKVSNQVWQCDSCSLMIRICVDAGDFDGI